MAIIETNKPNWFGNGSEPLKSGYIYVGEEYKDPQTFPVTVTFQDSAGATFTAAQPLRTNNQGQIVYDGKAIIATVDINYSLLILDSTQTQITDGYIPSIATTGGSVVPTSVRYFQTLADLKAGDVVVNEMVTTAGNTTNTDNNGATWVIVAGGTGTADDELFVDLNNGLQAQLNESTQYQITHRAVSGYTFQPGYYSVDQTISDSLAGAFPSTSASSNAFGPTGSGASVILTILDVLPSNCEYIDVVWEYIGAASADAYFLINAGRTSGYTEDISTAQTSGFIDNVVNSRHYGDGRIYLNANNSFSASLNSETATVISTGIMNLAIKGFGIAN